MRQAARPVVSVNVGFVQQLAELEQRVRGSCSLDPHEYAVQQLWSMAKAGFVENQSGQGITEAHCRFAMQACPLDERGMVGAMSWLESADLDLCTVQPTQTERQLAEGAASTTTLEEDLEKN